MGRFRGGPNQPIPFKFGSATLLWRPPAGVPVRCVATRREQTGMDQSSTDPAAPINEWVDGFELKPIPCAPTYPGHEATRPTDD
jgi:hypothetical protein